jgi:hypothetical protein
MGLGGKEINVHNKKKNERVKRVMLKSLTEVAPRHTCPQPALGTSGWTLQRMLQSALYYANTILRTQAPCIPCQSK